jgi:hypothetical protein
VDSSGQMGGGRLSNWCEVDELLECWNVEQGNPGPSYKRLSQGMRLRVGSRA